MLDAGSNATSGASPDYREAAERLLISAALPAAAVGRSETVSPIRRLASARTPGWRPLQRGVRRHEQAAHAKREMMPKITVKMAPITARGIDQRFDSLMRW